MDIKRIAEKITLLKYEEIDDYIKELENLNEKLSKDIDGMPDFFVEDVKVTMKLVYGYIYMLKAEKKRRLKDWSLTAIIGDEKKDESFLW
jgi:hypothetical protein